ncbi:hypothetical protein BGX31_004897 [Mortierella sp. GBA43]|nr:hypothetical protein BGX31_004897 [Mortierella sp. GBA43]
MSPHTNTSSYATVSRTSYRKTGSGQHPLAVVSTFDSDHDSSDGADNSDSIIGYTRHATSRGTHLEQFSTVSTQTADAASSAESSKDKHLSTSTHNSVWANKQSDSSIFKDTKSEPEHLYMLHTKSETSIGSQDTTHERDWASVAIASGVDQPISPLDASCSVMVSPFVLSTIDHTLTAPDVEQPQTPPPPESTTATPPTPSTPSKRADFEMWTPPPPRERQQPQQQPALRQPQSRLPIHKILKHRSFYFPFSSSQSGDPSSSQNGVNQSSGRASTDGLSEREGCNLDNQRSRATGSCDIPRSVGPPDPIPPHYQHLQNRQSLLPFRRRSHGGELDRLPTGWVVNEGAILTQGTPRTSVSDDQSPNTVPSQAPTPRRQISSGAQPSSRWGRLFTSFFPSGSGSENRDRENSNRESNGDDGDVFLSHQRLLLATSNQYTQQPIHPMYQQQLFFYADEVVDRADSSNAVSRDEDYMYQGGSSSEGGSDREDAPPFIPFSMSSLEANTVLQRELAQEDRHESMEIMNSDEPTYERSSTPTILTGDGFVVPKTLSSDGKIPVSSLALSSPPSYWESAIKYQGWPKIEPRPEQGQEDLPRYTCSVFREGCVNRKTELIGNWRPYRRPWKRTFAHLRGTALRLYAVDSEDVPRLHVRNISLQMAKCEMATDYRQRTNVIRIQSCDRTVLFECKDRVDALTWLEHLQAAANIATSLEDRLMPKFHTLPRAPAPSGARGSRAQSTSSTISSVSSHQSSTDHQEQQSEPMQQDHQTNLEQSPPSPPQGPLRERQRQLSVEQPSSSQPTPYQQLQQILQSQQEQILMIQNRVHQQKLAQQLEVQSNMSASVLNRGSGLVADPEESEPAQLPSSSHSNRRVSGNDSSQDQQQHQSRRPSQSQSTQQTRLAEEDQQHEARLRDEDAVTRSMLHALGQSSESDSSSDDDDLDSEEDEPRSRRHASRRRHHDATSLATFRQRQQQRQQQLQAQQQEQSQQTNGSHQESTTASNETPALVSARPAHHRERYRQVEEQVRAYRGEDWEQAYAVYARQQELQIELREREQRQGQRQEQRRQRASWNRRMFFGLWGHHDPHVTATMAASQAQQHHDQPLALAAYT